MLRPGLHELPMGTTLRELVFDHGGGVLAGKAFKAVFTGGTDNSKTVEVSHTPKVRPVPVEITPAKCG